MFFVSLSGQRTAICRILIDLLVTCKVFHTDNLAAFGQDSLLAKLLEMGDHLQAFWVESSVGPRRVSPCSDFACNQGGIAQIG